jgi:hypothetical protein
LYQCVSGFIIYIFIWKHILKISFNYIMFFWCFCFKKFFFIYS